MKLKKPLPKNRTLEQIENHYLVEKTIAEKLKRSSHEERKRIYATMYDELFSKVPDHPRLIRRDEERATQRANEDKFSLIGKFIDRSVVLAEFAPGDCRFAMELAKHAKYVYAIDISDQRDPDRNHPDNFKFVVYDGDSLQAVDENSIDIAFSDQLIEHIHPTETRSHFQLVHHILKQGGRYVFRTPHAFTGPHDISEYFCDEPEGFHLKEWTYTEIKQVLAASGYSRVITYWAAKGIVIRMPNMYFQICEKVLGFLPKRYLQIVSQYPIPGIVCAAVK